MHEIIDILEESCKITERELSDLNKKIMDANAVSPVDVEMLDKLTHTLKSVKTTMAMIEAVEERENGSRYSGARYSMGNGGGGYSNGYSNARGGNYSGEYSGANYSGEYSSARRSRYSRDGEKEEMVRKLEGMMRNARNEQEAMSIRETIEAVRRSEY